MNLVKLIESVKKQSNIYKNLHENDEAYVNEWKNVAEECQISSDEAQNQWNILLLEYMQYLRGNHEFSMSKHMDFIQPHLFTIVEDDIIDEDELLNILSEGKTQFETEATLLSGGKKLNREESFTAQYNSRDKTNVRISPDPEEIESAIKSTMKSNSPPPKSSLPMPSLTPKSCEAPPPALPTASIGEPKAFKESSFSNLSSMDLIFLGYAKQLQKMPLPLQQQTKRKIAEIMDEAELKMMDQL